MNVPSVGDPRWNDVFTRDKNYTIKFLGTKVLLDRLKLQYQDNNTPEELEKCKHELHFFFEKNIHIPIAADDLSEILGN